jgi:hypothetical protein
VLTRYGTILSGDVAQAERSKVQSRVIVFMFGTSPVKARIYRVLVDRNRMDFT